MTKIILLVTGGAVGTLSRYAISGLTHKYFDGIFPLGTLFVNFLGSFLIGFIWGLLEAENISSNMRTFIFIGILGGFTTFSTYTLETLNLFRDGEMKLALTNILANNILGLVLVFIGFAMAKGIFNILR